MKLHALLGVNALEDLAAACSRGEVAVTKGLGPALERKILQGIAIADGLRNGRGLIAARNEEAIYKSLGLAFVPPELREGTDEIKRARKGVLPHLIAMKDLKGVLH